MRLRNGAEFFFRNLLIFVVICVFLIYLFSQPTPMDNFSQSLKKMQRQYSEEKKNEMKQKMLEDVLTSSRTPRKDLKSIFFIESHAASDKVLKLTTRQACSVEAAGNKVQPSLLWIKTSSHLRSKVEPRPRRLRFVLVRGRIF